MIGDLLYMGSGPILFARLAQGFSLGLTFIPLQLLALSILSARGAINHVLSCRGR
jgi:hypothetical protein